MKIKKLLGIFFLSIIPLSVFSQREVLERQAENGNIEALLYLGDKYYNGSDGYPQNLNKSYNYYSKAAIQGNAEAQWQLYLMLMLGEGIEKDEKKAEEWLKKAAEQNQLEALLTLAENKYHNKDYKECIKLLKKYEELGGLHPFAWELLGVCYFSGPEGVKKDYNLAQKYFNLCVSGELDWEEKGNNAPYPQQVPGYAAYGLGLIYQEGLNGTTDLDQAESLFKFAISRNKDNLLYHEALGTICLYKNDLEHAKIIWEFLLRRDPNIIKSDCTLALAFGESIDYIIPENNLLKKNTLAIIIANENYKRVPNVPHAINDGAVFKKYLTSTFGVPEENIEYLEDASLNDIKYALSNVSQRCEAFKDQMNVIVYYAGHGVPDDKTNEAYLLPVDGFGTDPKSGLNMDDFYESLSEMPAKSVIVLLDACFSGAKRDGGMLMATRGITIKPNMKVPDGKLIVLSATAEDQTAFPIEEQKHGLFTYTLLRKIQETNGDITWGELADYVTETVKTRSIDLAGKLQSPTVSVSPSIKDSWRNLKIR